MDDAQKKKEEAFDSLHEIEQSILDTLKNILLLEIELDMLKKRLYIVDDEGSNSSNRNVSESAPRSAKRKKRKVLTQ